MDTPSRHVVFTIPKRLRIYLRYDRSLGSILFNAAWGAIHEVLGADEEKGTPGAVLTLQSAGEAINFHPHLHGVLADGLFLPDGSFASFALIDQGKLTQRFSEQVLASLHARELITDDVVSQTSPRSIPASLSGWETPSRMQTHRDSSPATSNTDPSRSKNSRCRMTSSPTRRLMGELTSLMCWNSWRFLHLTLQSLTNP